VTLRATVRTADGHPIDLFERENDQLAVAVPDLATAFGIKRHDRNLTRRLYKPLHKFKAITCFARRTTCVSSSGLIKLLLNRLQSRLPSCRASAQKVIEALHDVCRKTFDLDLKTRKLLLYCFRFVTYCCQCASSLLIRARDCLLLCNVKIRNLLDPHSKNPHNSRSLLAPRSRNPLFRSTLRAKIVWTLLANVAWLGRPKLADPPVQSVLRSRSKLPMRKLTDSQLVALSLTFNVRVARMRSCCVFI